MFRTIGIMAVLAVLPVCALSCSRKARKVTIGVSNIGSESAWHVGFKKSVQQEADRRGCDLRYQDAQVRQDNQVRAVRSFVNQKLDVIVLVPIVETGWDNVLQEARRAKIPVILVGRGIKVDQDGLYVTLIASDFIEEGMRAGQWLAQKTGGKAKIVQLEGTAGAAAAIDRKKGFEQALAGHPEMKIIASQCAEFTRAKGKEVMEAILKAQATEVSAVYAHNDDMALGAIQALQEAGRRPGQDVIVISIDGVKAAFEEMVKGRLNATVECTPMMGPVLMDTIQKVLAGQAVPRYIKNDDRLFEQSQAAELIQTREY